jgi:hypothetical protein
MRYIIPTLFFCFISFSQSKDSIAISNSNKTLSFNIKFDSLSKITPNFNYNFKATDTTLFSVYNQNTKLIDYFNVSKDSIYVVKSINYNPNQFIQKDSFNPNGVRNLGGGLIMGSVNTVFNFIFK